MKCHHVGIVSLLSTFSVISFRMGKKRCVWAKNVALHARKKLFFPNSGRRFRQQRYVNVRRLRSLRYVTALKVLVYYGSRDHAISLLIATRSSSINLSFSSNLFAVCSLPWPLLWLTVRVTESHACALP
jgi:hypothetical protein